MKELIANLRGRHRSFILAMILFWAAYVVVSLLAPTVVAENRYGLSSWEAKLLRITVFLPYLLIWFSALVAVLNFRDYAPLVANSPESWGFSRMYRGLVCLALAVFIPVLVSLVRSFNPQDEGVVRNVTIINNYINVILYVVAFWNIWQGSLDLKKTLPASEESKQSTTWVTICIVFLSAVYVWAVFHNPTRTISGDKLLAPTYYLPDILILLTIVLPYVLVWLWGGLAITNLHAFAKGVPGQIYRQAFTTIARGLTAIIGLSILIQFLSQAGRYFSQASLGAILLIIYLLLIIIAVGYILVAKGASKLTAIERV